MHINITGGCAFSLSLVWQSHLFREARQHEQSATNVVRFIWSVAQLTALVVVVVLRLLFPLLPALVVVVVIGRLLLLLEHESLR